MELRSFPRFQVRFRSTFSSPLMTGGEGLVTNVSIGGCRVSSSAKVAKNTELELHLYLTDRDVPLEVNRAAVRWVSGGEFGMEFLQMDGAATTRLQAYLETC